MKKKIIILLCLSFFCLKIQSQNSPENKLGNWYMYNGSHKLSEKIALKTMAHFRYYELASEFQQEIYRLGFNYSFNSKTNLTLGYSYVNTDTGYKVPSINVEENRIYEDLNLKSKWGKFNARHRFRVEHRFFNSTDRHWIRYDLNVSYPLSEKWNVYAFNEIFFHLDQSKRFAQNWTGTGFTYKLNNNLKFKTGYFQIKTHNVVFKRLQFGVILNTNHVKKTK